jgi:hypothetical protein
MPTVLTPPRSPAPPVKSDLVLAAFGIAVLASLLVFAGRALRLPPHVDRVTVANPHVWDAQVDVAAVPGDGWLGMGTVERESEQSFREVLDMGGRWTFRFSYGGEEVEVTVDRAQLENNDWRVGVPPSFAERLVQAGVEQSSQ